MNIGAIIPARYDSSRFPGKPLARIAGMSMIERVYQKVRRSEKFDQIIVATDNKEIAAEVKRFGGNFSMTSPDCPSGSDRVWEVLEKSGLDAAINIQGDEPLISEKLISEIYTGLEERRASVVTAAYFNNSFNEFNSVNTVKTIIDKNGMALYFSRASIPSQDLSGFEGFFHHIGIYGYTREALSSFIHFPLSELELKERLEQLRFLDNGIDIYVLKTDYRSVSVDVPEDIGKIEKILRIIK